MAIAKLLANNKKAYHDYFIDFDLECGIELKGTEVKSIRAGKVSIKEAYADIKGGEVWLRGMHVSAYEYGNIHNVDAMRERKLLLHRREITKIANLIQQKGYTMVPLKVYIDYKGRVKVQLGIARGKKQYDKRQTIAKKESDRRIARELKNHR